METRYYTCKPSFFRQNPQLQHACEIHADLTDMPHQHRHRKK